MAEQGVNQDRTSLQLTTTATTATTGRCWHDIQLDSKYRLNHASLPLRTIPFQVASMYVDLSLSLFLPLTASEGFMKLDPGVGSSTYVNANNPRQQLAADIESALDCDA